MKPKKKEQTEQPCCAEPSFDLCYDTLNVDTLGAKMFETVEGLKPSFPGDLFKFIAAHLQYPPELAESTVSGRVIIKFFVTPSGRCCLFRVMRSVDPYLDREALRVLKLMPAWKWERDRSKEFGNLYLSPSDYYKPKLLMLSSPFVSRFIVINIAINP